MDVVRQPNQGWVEVIVGSMFSGKSEELIRRLRRAQIARQKVQIFKPKIDNRYGDDHITSHSEMRIPSANSASSRDLLADVTVFQSAWGRRATFGPGIIGQDGPVIHNPVDTDRFCPAGERVPLPGRVRVAHVAFSTNARKEAAAIWPLDRRRPDLQFIMVGRYESAPALDNLTFLGYAGWERLPAVLRGCDVFVTFTENETCSNAVLEALATGLPVLYRASGGTGELVGPGGAPVEIGTFDLVLEEILDRRPALAEAARARAVGSFGFDAIFPRYLDALQTASRRPLPGPAGCLRTLARVPPPAGAVAHWVAARARLRRAIGPSA